MKQSPELQQPIVWKTAVVPVLVTVICLFGHLGAIGLLGPDEPRYAWIARAMAATGDWVTPRLYGDPWFEKPVLYYWAAGVGFLLHLTPEWAARLPSAFAALAASITIGWLGWKHHDRGASWLGNPAMVAPVLFSSSVAAIGFARAATPDMLFSACITLAMASAASVFHRAGALQSGVEITSSEGRDTLPLLLFGASLGLGVLAKGPAAVILAGGAISLWGLATRQWRLALRLGHPWAILAFSVTALPWYVICALRNSDFIRIFIFQHNFERYLTPVFQHRQPFWFFGPIVLLALLPWTVLLWPAAGVGLELWHKKSWPRSPGFFWACWAVFPVLFFSFSQSKLPGYILPSIPPLALLCAVTLARLGRGSPLSRLASRRLTTSGAVVGLTWLVLGISLERSIIRLPQAARDAAGGAIFISAILAVIGAIGISLLALVRKHWFLVLSLCLTIVSLELAGVRILPALDPYFSARWHAVLLRNDLHPERVFIYDLPRSWTYGLDFYLERRLPEWSPADPNAALVLTTSAGLNKMRQIGRFHGSLDETPIGILYVPITPTPR